MYYLLIHVFAWLICTCIPLCKVNKCCIVLFIVNSWYLMHYIMFTNWTVFRSVSEIILAFFNNRFAHLFRGGSLFLLMWVSIAESTPLGVVAPALVCLCVCISVCVVSVCVCMFDRTVWNTLTRSAHNLFHSCRPIGGLCVTSSGLCFVSPDLRLA